MGRRGKDKDGESRKLAGIQAVRPPQLKFHKVKETKHHTEWEVTTFKDAKTDSEPRNADDRTFTNDINSLIFCNANFIFLSELA